jgi:hypothetical protein
VTISSERLAPAELETLADDKFSLEDRPVSERLLEKELSTPELKRPEDSSEAKVEVSVGESEQAQRLIAKANTTQYFI